MPIISAIGRKSWRVRLFDEGIFVALLVGALTMLYPFLLMLAGSTKSAVDLRDIEIVPGFLRDDAALYRKHIEALFDERLDSMRAAYDEDVSSFEQLQPPAQVDRARVEQWEAFLRSRALPPTAYSVGHMGGVSSRTLPRNLRAFKAGIAARFGDLATANRELGTAFVNWSAFMVLPEDLLSRRGHVGDAPFDQALAQFKSESAERWRCYYLADGFFKNAFLKTQYSRDIAEYNRAHHTAYASYADLSLTPRLPDGTSIEKTDWERFVRQSLNLLWVRVDESATGAYRDYLHAKYPDIATLNTRYGTSFASFDDIPLVHEPPSGGLVLSDWDAFIQGWKDPASGRVYAPTAQQLYIKNTLFDFQEFVGDPHARPPLKEAHYLAFLDARKELRWEFVKRNYLAVFDYLLIHGRGVWNTLWYCALAVLSALIVNPLAAYALSRFRLPGAYRVLMFLLLTMAFPAMVTQIPNFLLIRDLGLLNTFWALILPSLANGYSIFLLKGFFDSLPRELYECAELDGAGEWTTFWHITMSLSKPILAVTALAAFNIAYANFMYALLICQDEKMWTLMVWLYQLRLRAGPGVVQASLILAAIPTFVIFLFCQNIILRGIIIPSEK